MKRKTVLRVLSVLCVAAMLLAPIAGCATGTPAPAATTAAATDAQTSTAPDTSAPPAAKTYDTHIVLSMDAIDADKAGKDANGNPDPVYTWLCNKFNVEISWVPVTWDNYFMEAPTLWMASGTQPDVMMLDISPSRYPTFIQWVNDGCLKAWPDLTPYPTLKANWDSCLDGKQFAVDGTIYAYPSFIDLGKYQYIADKCYMYRKDMAAAVNLASPNDEYTWDQWIALIKAVQAKNPGMIGLIGDDWTIPRCLEGVRAISPGLLQYVKGADGKWAWGPMLPESLTAVKYTKQLYDEGIIWKDEPIVKNGDDPGNNFVAGKAFAQVGGNFNVAGFGSGTLAKFEQANPGIKGQDVIGLAMVKAPDGKFLSERTSDHWTETGFAPKLSDEKMLRWLDVQEYLTSQEGYLLRGFGIPNTDWTLNADGTINLLWPKDENGVQQAPTGLGWGNSWQWAYRGGTTDGIAMLSPLEPEWARNMTKHVFERLQQSDVTVLPFDVQLNYFNAPNYNQVGTMERDIYQEIAKIMANSTADSVEADWTAWVQAQMPKIQPVLDEMNAQLK